MAQETSKERRNRIACGVLSNVESKLHTRYDEDWQLRVEYVQRFDVVLVFVPGRHNRADLLMSFLAFLPKSFASKHNFRVCIFGAEKTNAVLSVAKLCEGTSSLFCIADIVYDERSGSIVGGTLQRRVGECGGLYDYWLVAGAM